jgi:hypothetical protein
LWPRSSEEEKRFAIVITGNELIQNWHLDYSHW